MAITIKELINFPNGLAISWSDNKESFIEYLILRDNCPCANCSGESDVFGNLYINKKSKYLEQKSYQIIKYSFIGHYALRIVWGDGHNAGIYSFELLRGFGDKK